MSLNSYNASTGESVTLANGMRLALYTQQAYETAKQQGKVANNILVGIVDDYPTDETNDYSTDETKTFSKWIDGKPIYRKVVNLSTMPNNTIKSVAHRISNISIFTSIRGIAKGFGASAGTYIPLPYAHSVSSSNIALTVDNTNVNVSTSTDYTNYGGYAILEYTKTTDT